MLYGGRSDLHLPDFAMPLWFKCRISSVNVVLSSLCPVGKMVRGRVVGPNRPVVGSRGPSSLRTLTGKKNSRRAQRPVSGPSVFRAKRGKWRSLGSARYLGRRNYTALWRKTPYCRSKDPGKEACRNEISVASQCFLIPNRLK